MGKGAGGWTTYLVVMLVAGLVVTAACTQLIVRFRDPGPRPTWGEMLGSFLIVSIVGVFGYTFADSLQGEVKMQMTADHWWNATLGNWPQLQGAVGWMLAMFMFVGLWATLSQVARSWPASKNVRTSK
jgi:O-antigen/teichoic acid export membrane protein